MCIVHPGSLTTISAGTSRCSLPTSSRATTASRAPGGAVFSTTTGTSIVWLPSSPSAPREPLQGAGDDMPAPASEATTSSSVMPCTARRTTWASRPPTSTKQYV